METLREIHLQQRQELRKCFRQFENELNALSLEEKPSRKKRKLLKELLHLLSSMIMNYDIEAELIKEANSKFIIEMRKCRMCNWNTIPQLNDLNMMIDKNRIQIVLVDSIIFDDANDVIFIASDEEAFKILENSINFLKNIQQ